MSSGREPALRAMLDDGRRHVDRLLEILRDQDAKAVEVIRIASTI